MPNMAKAIRMYGNNTKNHERALNPFWHNHPKRNVQMKAKNNLKTTAITLTPLNSATTEAITAIAK